MPIASLEFYLIRKVRPNEIKFLNLIRPNLTSFTYPHKPLDSMDFKAKESLESSSVWSNRIMKILKKCLKKLKKFEIRVFDSVHYNYDYLSRLAHLV